MGYTFFSHNGTLLPIAQASVPLNNIAYQYGFGVYESIRVSRGLAYFKDEHIARLLGSARTIGLEHTFSDTQLSAWIDSLVQKTDEASFNLKLLLIGGSSPELYITCSSPLFPDRKLYKSGVACLTTDYERILPHAKSLNMFASYRAYEQAKKAGAYESLLIDSHGTITEGTRTNFFAIQDKTVYTPPDESCLLGVTRTHVLAVAQQLGFKIVQRALPLKTIDSFEAVFITSTSSKILPVRSINEITWTHPVSSDLHSLMDGFDAFLNDYKTTNAISSS